MFFRKHNQPETTVKPTDEFHFKNKESYLPLFVDYPYVRYCLISSVFLASWLLLLTVKFPINSSAEDDVAPEKPRPVSVCTENVSVYVYDLPEKFNAGILKDCRKLNMFTDMCPHVANDGLGQPMSAPGRPFESPGWFATNQFTSETIFHARIRNHACRTREPEKADLFYVPFYGGFDTSRKFKESDLKVRDALGIELSEFLSEQRWWRRRGGKDHFLVLGRTAWEFMRGENDYDALGNRFLNLPLIRNLSALVIEKHPWQGSNQRGIPYPSYFHPSTAEEMAAWQDEMRRTDRPYLFSFIGGPRKSGEGKANTRNEVIRQCAASRQCELLRCGGGASKCHSPGEVMALMTKSKFCLQTPGDSFTRRSTFDALLAGCVPVFFSPHTAYTQYGWYLPAEGPEYSVYIDDSKKNIEEELKKIPEEEMEKMREKVIGSIPAVTYVHPNSSRHGFRDAVDVALLALLKETREVRTQPINNSG